LDSATSIHTALLLHDGELDDLRSLLDTIGVSSVERRGRILDADADRSWDLVIATPAKLFDLDSNLVGQRVCISESDSRTLRIMLERADVRFVIVRPVHPEALKQVLVQALYSGPENRQSMRRAAGQFVRFRSGWRRERGILADLSETGCRLLAPRSLATGSNLSVYVPLRADSRKTLSVRGTVVRASLTDGPQEERHAIHVHFGELSNKVALSLSEIVERLAAGPAVLPTRDTGAAAERRTTTVAAEGGGSSVEPVVPKAITDEAVDRADEPLVDSGSGESERRSDPRLVYSSRIIVLGDGPARVLIAKDISSSGLLAETHPGVAVGDELQVAIPLPGEKVPLIVKARVIRNQGGLALAFEDLPPDSYERLQRRLELLPQVESGLSEDEEPARVIVSEVR